MQNSSIDRRAFVRTVLAAATVAPALGAGRNIYWGLGAVTWTAKAGRDRKVRWADILPDIAAGGFDGFEPFTTPALPVNDENMAELEQLAPRYKLRMSSIYWADRFDRASEHDRIRKEIPRFLGYLKRFSCDRLTIGPPPPTVEDEREAIGNMARIMDEIGRIALEQYNIKTGVHPHVGGLI